MKQAVMKRWVDALRSKKYKQTREQLRELDAKGKPTNGFCCLGVLCDLFAKEHPDAKWLDREKTEVAMKGRSTGCAFSVQTEIVDSNKHEFVSVGMLPKPVRLWAGIKNTCGEFTLTDNVRKRDFRDSPEARFADSLSELNDAAGFNFAEIAAFVEKHWRKL